MKWCSRRVDALMRGEFIDVVVGKNCAQKEENQVFALSLIVLIL